MVGSRRVDLGDGHFSNPVRIATEHADSIVQPANSLDQRNRSGNLSAVILT